MFSWYICVCAVTARSLSFTVRRYVMSLRDVGALPVFEIHSVYHVESRLGREDCEGRTGGNRDDRRVS